MLLSECGSSGWYDDLIETNLESEASMILEHVNLTVSDLQRSIDFYCKLFEFRVRWRADAAAARPLIESVFAQKEWSPRKQ
jgi:hypothetical protein